MYIYIVYSLLHLMHASACTHASTLATNLMHVKNSMHHFLFITLIVWNIGMKKIKERSTASV